MERLTLKKSNGNFELYNFEEIEKAILKLGKFEEMYDVIVENRDKIVLDMEKLTLQGKNKTVTYKQLIANKLLLTNIISYFDIYVK